MSSFVEDMVVFINLARVDQFFRGFSYYFSRTTLQISSDILAHAIRSIRQSVAPGASALIGGMMRFGPFLLIAILLFFLWIGAFTLYHVTSGLIHLLLLFALISFVAHLFAGSRTA